MPKQYNPILMLLLLFFSLNSCHEKQFPTKQKTPLASSSDSESKKTIGILGDSAMVVTAHPLATQVGFDILQQGGNAIDASIAVQMALTVVYPRAGNIGGGGFMIYRENTGTAHTLDFRETAPAAAHRDMYLDEKGEVIDRLSLDGHLAVGVPGVVDGCVQAHQKFGKLAWHKLLQPAIDLAQKGYALTPAEADYMNRFRPEFEKMNTQPNLFLSKKEDWKAGDTIVQKDLATTLTLIQDKLRAGFYEGVTGSRILEEMKRGGGIITAEDLKNYRAKWRAPIVGQYQEDYTIFSMPPPSSGGICLLQILEMLETENLGASAVHSAKNIHVINEAERLAYADRSEHLGDADFYAVPIQELLDTQYLDRRKAQINPQKATRSAMISAGKMPSKESEETTHFSIVDTEGNAVSLTTTLNSNYGSKVIVGGAGFLLNNEMDDFSAKPGVPNQFGLVGKEANAIEAGKRMLSSMTPTIVEKKGELFMLLGSPGGSTIITSVVQNFLNVVEFDMTMQEAVNHPRFHHQWRPDTLFTEKNAFSTLLKDSLTTMGHTLVERTLSIGRVDAILVHENGQLEGAADPRGEDAAKGW